METSFDLYGSLGLPLPFFVAVFSTSLTSLALRSASPLRSRNEPPYDSCRELFSVFSRTPLCILRLKTRGLLASFRNRRSSPGMVSAAPNAGTESTISVSG